MLTAALTNLTHPQLPSSTFPSTNLNSAMARPLTIAFLVLCWRKCGAFERCLGEVRADFPDLAMENHRKAMFKKDIISGFLIARIDYRNVLYIIVPFDKRVLKHFWNNLVSRMNSSATSCLRFCEGKTDRNQWVSCAGLPPSAAL